MSGKKIQKIPWHYPYDWLVGNYSFNINSMSAFMYGFS